MATKIRLQRFGKKFYAFYRVVITDSRNKRDGQSIEEIGFYDPNKQPSLIDIKSDRVQYWLGVGAQPDAQARVEAVEAQAQKLKAAKSEASAAAKVEAAADAGETANKADTADSGKGESASDAKASETAGQA